MRFENLDPWPEAVPLIELEFQGSTLDLHNWGEFVGFSFEAPDSLSVRFRHWAPDGDPGEEGTAIGMRFRSVRRLVVTQAPDFEPRVVGVLGHWLWQDRGDRGRVVFSFGDLDLEFRAEAVEIESVSDK
jgi:hypothetical protein